LFALLITQTYSAKVHDHHSPTQVNQKAANATLIKGHSAKKQKGFTLFASTMGIWT